MQDKHTEAVNFRKKQDKRPCECECGAGGASRTSDVTVPESAGGRKSDHRESSESGVCLTAHLSTAARKHEQLAKRRARTRHRKICFSEGIIPDVQVARVDPPIRGGTALVGKTIAGRFRNKTWQCTNGGAITTETSGILKPLLRATGSPGGEGAAEAGGKGQGLGSPLEGVLCEGH